MSDYGSRVRYSEDVMYWANKYYDWYFEESSSTFPNGVWYSILFGIIGGLILAYNIKIDGLTVLDIYYNGIVNRTGIGLFLIPSILALQIASLWFVGGLANLIYSFVNIPFVCLILTLLGFVYKRKLNKLASIHNWKTAKRLYDEELKLCQLE